MSLISIIVPLYNQERYIEQCIKSIQNQSIYDIKIIIVDDGSTDKSGIICDSIAESDNRVLVIHQENKGLSAARLTGLMKSDTKYITFVDADDFIADNAYEDAIPFLNNNFDQVLYEISRFYDNGRVKRENHIVSEGKYNRNRIIKEIYPKLIWDNERKAPGIECSLCVRLVKRELILNIYEKLKDRSYYYGEDMMVSYPLMIKTQSLAIISKSYYMHRQRKDNVVPSYIVSDQYFDELQKVYSCLKNIMKEDKNYDFSKQIDYMYIYSVELKKKTYNDYELPNDYLFPFNKIQYGKKVILYGAGNVGKTYYKQLIKLNYCSELLWVDRDAEYLNDERVRPIMELDNKYYYTFDVVVIAIENNTLANSIKCYLISKGYKKEKIVI